MLKLLEYQWNILKNLEATMNKENETELETC